MLLISMIFSEQYLGSWDVTHSRPPRASRSGPAPDYNNGQILKLRNYAASPDSAENFSLSIGQPFPGARHNAVRVGIRIIQIDVIAETIAKVITPIRVGTFDNFMVFFDQIDAADACVGTIEC